MIDPKFVLQVGKYLRGVHVGILTPTIRGYCPLYKMAFHQTLAVAQELGATVECIDMVGQSCLPKGRNQLVYDALEYQAADKGFDYQFHIDDDVGWKAYDFWYCVALAVKNSYPVIGGNYPKKEIYWESVAEYVKMRVGEGAHDKITATSLRRASQEFAATMPIEVNIDAEGVCEMYGLPMGWACVHHQTFRDLAPKLPSYVEKGMEIPEWFDDRHVGPEKRGVYMGEDISFFQHLRESGVPARCLTTAELTHTGNYTWVGAPVDDFLIDER